MTYEANRARVREAQSQALARPVQVNARGATAKASTASAAVAAVIVVGAIALGVGDAVLGVAKSAVLNSMGLGWMVSSSPSDPALGIFDDPLKGKTLAELQANKSALVADGMVLSAGRFSVRDWSMEDGDIVVVNGKTIPLKSVPQVVPVQPGPVTISAIGGSQGCNSVEIIDAVGPRQLCLDPAAQPIEIVAR